MYVHISYRLSSSAPLMELCSRFCLCVCVVCVVCVVYVVCVVCVVSAMYVCMYVCM